jgi:hypothetical protein
MLGMTSPPLSRALNDALKAHAEAGSQATVCVDKVEATLVHFKVEAGAADCEDKVFGIWTMKEITHYLKEGADGCVIVVGRVKIAALSSD